jgi:hypothetical protein
MGAALTGQSRSQPADKLVVVWRRMAGEDDVALGQLLLGYGLIVPRHAQTAADASEIGIQWACSCISVKSAVWARPEVMRLWSERRDRPKRSCRRAD